MSGRKPKDESGMTQSELILAALHRGRHLSPLDALNEFGSLRLGARIWDLKKLGYNIWSEKAPHEGFQRYFIRPADAPFQQGEGPQGLDDGS